MFEITKKVHIQIDAFKFKKMISENWYRLYSPSHKDTEFWKWIKTTKVRDRQRVIIMGPGSIVGEQEFYLKKVNFSAKVVC